MTGFPIARDEDGPIVLSPETYNRFAEAAGMTNRNNRGVVSRPRTPSAVTVEVFNPSSQWGWPVGHPVHIGPPMSSGSLNDSLVGLAIEDRVCRGVEIGLNKRLWMADYGILMDPVPASGTGEAVVFGVAVTKVDYPNFEDDDGQYVDFNEEGKLEVMHYGFCRLLSVEKPTTEKNTDLWAQVFVGQSNYQIAGTVKASSINPGAEGLILPQSQNDYRVSPNSELKAWNDYFGAQAIDVGFEVSASYYLAERRWRITAAQCPAL